VWEKSRRQDRNHMIEAREQPQDGTWGACTGACAPLANVWEMQMYSK